MAQLGSFGQLALDLADQPAVARQAKQEVHAVIFAPIHQSVAGKAGIGPQQDPHRRPALPDPGDEPRRLLNRPGAAIDIGRAQLGRQQVPAAEHVKRQVAVIVVIAVEEAAFLMPVQRVVGGVEIEDDLRRRRRVSIEKEIDKQPFDLGRVVADLVIARRFGPAQFQPVQRALAGQRRTIRAPRFELASQHRHHRVVAQFVMIDQILVAQRDAKYALPDQGRNRVLDQILRSAVLETPGKPINQPDRPVARAKQHRAGIRGHLAAVESGNHRSAIDGCKSKQIRATLCLHRASPDPETNRSRNTIFSDSAARCTYPFEKSGLAVG